MKIVLGLLTAALLPCLAAARAPDSATDARAALLAESRLKPIVTVERRFLTLQEALDVARSEPIRGDPTRVRPGQWR